MSGYTEFVSQVLGLLNTLEILQPLKYFLLMIVSLAGMMAFVRFLGGQGR